MGLNVRLVLLVMASLCLTVGAWMDKGAAAAETMKLQDVLKNETKLDDYFTRWASQHGLVYGAQSPERAARLAQFRRGLEAIVRINSDENSTYWAAPNAFTAMSFQEFSAAYLHTSVPEGQALASEHGALRGRNLLSKRSLLSRVNWVERGMVTPIKSQGGCGACWAFAAVAALESKYLITRGQKLDLSEQHMIDCVNAATGYSSNGCQGGWPPEVLRYAARYNVTTEAKYPYTGTTGVCNTALLSQVSRRDVARIKRSRGYIPVPRRSPSALMQAVANQPVVTAFAASESFQYYGGGIYSAASCQGANINHALLTVGYRAGSTADGSWWLVRNSWGRDWGEGGYARVQMLEEGSEGACLMYYYNWEPRAVLRVPQ